MPADSKSDLSKRPYSYCALCGYMFIKTPPDPPVPCRCGAMQEQTEVTA